MVVLLKASFFASFLRLHIFDCLLLFTGSTFARFYTLFVGGFLKF